MHTASVLEWPQSITLCDVHYQARSKVLLNLFQDTNDHPHYDTATIQMESGRV